MQKAKTKEAISAVVAEVETLAKRLRTDLRKAAVASGLDKRLRLAARRLRKQAIQAAGYVEKYAHRVRLELQPKKRQPRQRRARTRRAAA